MLPVLTETGGENQGRRGCASLMQIEGDEPAEQNRLEYDEFGEFAILRGQVHGLPR